MDEEPARRPFGPRSLEWAVRRELHPHEHRLVTPRVTPVDRAARFRRPV